MARSERGIGWRHLLAVFVSLAAGTAAEYASAAAQTLRIVNTTSTPTQARQSARWAARLPTGLDTVLQAIGNATIAGLPADRRPALENWPPLPSHAR